MVLVLLLASCGDDPSTPATGTARPRSATSSSSGGATVVGTGSTPDELCWSTINEHRKSAGLQPLERWTESEACADGEAKSDGQANDSHGAFPRCGELAQNECPGVPGPVEDALPSCLQQMWDEGPGGGHHDNMATTKYTKVACGVFVTARGAVWAVQNYR